MSLEEVFSCRGKVALVTGAASGLGFMFAESMAEAGADVACVDIDMDGLSDTVRAVKALGRKAIAIHCDVADEGQVKCMVTETVEAFGTIDILFNNAGVGPRPCPVHELATEDWNRVIDIDLNGAFYCAREVLRVMVPRRSGKIINIASVWGVTGSSSTWPSPAYNAAKGALVNLTREMGLCYAPYGINVNAICPGFVKTNIGGKHGPDRTEFLEKTSTWIPMGRIGMPQELKGLAILLASDASSYMCGDIIMVDGGIVAK
ncbi:MAG: SDR family oxidoreductase [Thermoleophilia bacterium]|nr:SDR family oxidoreductase [Thermoleophilia bacterium]